MCSSFLQVSYLLFIFFCKSMNETFHFMLCPFSLWIKYHGQRVVLIPFCFGSPSLLLFVFAKAMTSLFSLLVRLDHPASPSEAPDSAFGAFATCSQTVLAITLSIYVCAVWIYETRVLKPRTTHQFSSTLPLLL